jgi:hypothetical protein
MRDQANPTCASTCPPNGRALQTWSVFGPEHLRTTRNTDGINVRACRGRRSGVSRPNQNEASAPPRSRSFAGSSPGAERAGARRHARFGPPATEPKEEARLESCSGRPTPQTGPELRPGAVPSLVRSAGARRGMLARFGRPATEPGEEARLEAGSGRSTHQTGRELRPGAVPSLVRSPGARRRRVRQGGPVRLGRVPSRGRRVGSRPSPGRARAPSVRAFGPGARRERRSPR